MYTSLCSHIYVVIARSASMSTSEYNSFDFEDGSEADCCHAISEESFVGVGELLCEAGRECKEMGVYEPRHQHSLKIIVAGESGVGKR